MTVFQNGEEMAGSKLPQPAELLQLFLELVLAEPRGLADFLGLGTLFVKRDDNAVLLVESPVLSKGLHGDPSFRRKFRGKLYIWGFPIVHMRELLTVEVKGRYFVVPKLVGAFFVFIALLMLVHASFSVLTAWDQVKDIRSCVDGMYTDGGNLAQAYSLCVLKGIAAGVYVYAPSPAAPGMSAVPTEEVWSVLLPRVAWWLFWVLVLILAIIVYRAGKLYVPIREEVKEVANVPTASSSSGSAATSTEKKEKRATRRRTATRRTTRKRSA